MIPFRTLVLVVASCLFNVATAAAQRAIPMAENVEVFRESVSVDFPLPYLTVREPNPPLEGFYAWKASFGGDVDLTVVLRADTAMRSSNSGKVVSASSLRRCPANATTVMDCTAPLRGRVHVGMSAITIEITDPEFVALLHKRQPAVVVRQVFEPGGRFRVDHITMLYR